MAIGVEILGFFYTRDGFLTNFCSGVGGGPPSVCDTEVLYYTFLFCSCMCSFVQKVGVPEKLLEFYQKQQRKLAFKQIVSAIFVITIQDCSYHRKGLLSIVIFFYPTGCIFWLTRTSKFLFVDSQREAHPSHDFNTCLWWVIRFVFLDLYSSRNHKELA